jgi:hypothetical protein
MDYVIKLGPRERVTLRIVLIVMRFYYIDAWKVMLQGYGHACPKNGSL